MVFQDRFSNHILPDKIHRLNVSFLVPGLRREFGGCAGNIAYNLKLLGDVGYPMATVGLDFEPYRAWMAKTGVPADHNKVSDAKNVTIGIVAPDGRDGMIQHAQQFAAAKIPFIFDPGQGLPMFGGDDIKQFVDQAAWVAV